ncbi:MAG: tetratricopeptide repeat protein, partial [Pseudomonadota bacterium]
MAKRRPSDAMHVTVTDHYIRRRPDRGSAGALVERNGANTPAYRGEVVLYYPAAIPERSERELYVAVAQVRDESNLTEGIRRLEKAMTEFRPAQGGFYLDLADAYRHAGRTAEAVDWYREACGRSPDDWRTFHGLGMELGATGDFAGAVTALDRALSLAPGQIEVLESLAEIFEQQNKLPEAVSTLRRAMAADPESADIRNNLGTALVRAGKLDQAEEALREAVRLRPEVPAMRVNLATLLSRQGRFAEAQFEFERAIRLNGAFAAAHSAYATALAAQGNLSAARDQFQAALRLNPQLWNTHNNLGT